MNDDIDNLERELMSLRPSQPGDALRQRIAAATAPAPSPRSGGEGWGEGAVNPASPSRPAPTFMFAHPVLRRTLAAGLAVAAAIALAIILGRGMGKETRNPPTPDEIVAIPPSENTAPLVDAPSPFTWLACRRAAAISEDTLNALLDDQARRMPALAGGMPALRADLFDSH